MFGYDFSYSSSPSTIAMDGMADDMDYGFNYAAGLDEFIETFGNASYLLVDIDPETTLLHGLGSLNDGRTVSHRITKTGFNAKEDSTPKKNYMREGNLVENPHDTWQNVTNIYSSNTFNDTVWQESRLLITSTTDSQMHRIVTLTVEEGGLSDFGRRCKVTMSLPRLANEYRYQSHRANYYYKTGGRTNFYGYRSQDSRTSATRSRPCARSSRRSTAPIVVENPAPPGSLEDDFPAPGYFARTTDFYNITRDRVPGHGLRAR